jgi:uncharacterized protein (DUF433 family)
MRTARAHASESPSIERIPGVRGGAPVIAGTGIRVLDVAVRYELLRMTPEEIMLALPHLTLPRIHTVLSYYYGHKIEVDREWKRALKQIERLRKSQPSLLEQKIGALANLHGRERRRSRR